MHFIKDFPNAFYKGFFEGIPNNDTNVVITKNLTFLTLRYQKYPTSKMVSEWL